MPTPAGTREIIGQPCGRRGGRRRGRPGPGARARPTPPVGVGAPGMVDRHGSALLRPQPAAGPGVDWTEPGRRSPARPLGPDRERRQLRRPGRAPPWCGLAASTTSCWSRSAPVSAAASSSTARSRWARRASPARSGTWWSTRPGPPARAGAGAVGSASPPVPGSGMLARQAALAGRLDAVVHLAGGDPESVRGEDVSAAAEAGDPAAQQVIRRGRLLGRLRPGQPGLCHSTPSASCSAAASSHAGDLLFEAARRAFAELVEGGAGARRWPSSRPPSASVPVPWVPRWVPGRAGCGDPGRRRPPDLPRHSRRRLRRGRGGRGRRDRRAVLLRPPLAHGPARAAGPGPVPAPRRPGGPSRSRSRRRGLRARSSARWSPASGSCPMPCSRPSSRRWTALAPGRVIAGLGTGDRLSAEENRAYGIPFHPAAQRRAEVVALAHDWRRRGSPSGWPAARPGAPTRRGRPGAALNVWDADPALVAERSTAAEALEVTWAGPPTRRVRRPWPRRCDLVAEAGATWAVFGWPVDVGALAARQPHAASPGPSSADRVGRRGRP